MDELYDYRQRLLERYAAIPGEFASRLASLSQEARYRPLEPGGLNLHQVIAHLRDVEAQAFLPRLERILSEEVPLLSNFNQDAWMKSYYRAGEPLEAILAEFKGLRSRECGRLKNMPQNGWNRVGRHPVWGVRTLQWWVERSLAHNEEHLIQIGSEG
jgi:hypothetical protein